jgi:hypothetical protein
MPKRSRTNRARRHRFALFLLLPRGANDGRTWPGCGLKACGPSRRFSAWVRWSHRCSQRAHKGGHGPSSLWQGQDRASGFPRPRDPCQHRTSHHQPGMSTRDHVRPALGSFWRPHARHIPQHHLRVNARALLVRGAHARGWADLSQRRLSRHTSSPLDHAPILWLPGE